MQETARQLREALKHTLKGGEEWAKAYTPDNPAFMIYYIDEAERMLRKALAMLGSVEEPCKP